MSELPFTTEMLPLMNRVAWYLRHGYTIQTVQRRIKWSEELESIVWYVERGYDLSALIEGMEESRGRRSRAS